MLNDVVSCHSQGGHKHKMARAEKLRTEKQRRERFRIQGLKIREKKGFRGGIHVTDGRDKQLCSREEIVELLDKIALAKGQE